MSETRAKEWKAGPNGTEKRANRNKSALSSKRDFRLGRRRIGTFDSPESNIAALFHSFDPTAIMGEDAGARAHHLGVFDKLVRVQNVLLFEDMMSRYPLIGAQAAMIYHNAIGTLIPRLLQLLETDPSSQVLCGSLLANFTAMAEAEQWVMVLLENKAHETFARVLAHPEKKCASSETLISIISCIGNICTEHGTFREYILPQLTPHLIAIAAEYPHQLKDVAFVVYAMCKRHPPVPSAELMTQWAPFMLNTLLTLQPIADDSVAVYPVKCILIGLQELTVCDEGARLAIAANKDLVARLVEFAVSESLHTDVRAISTDVLAQLTREESLHGQLVEARIPETFSRTLMCPDAYVRVAACRGLAMLARNPDLSEHLLPVRQSLLFQVDQGTREVRIAALDVLGEMVPYMSSSTVGQWLESGLIRGLYANFGEMGRSAQALLRFLDALEYTFRDPAFGKQAFASFDELGGEDALERVYGTVGDVLVGERIEKILETRFGSGGTMEVE